MASKADGESVTTIPQADMEKTASESPSCRAGCLKVSLMELESRKYGATSVAKRRIQPKVVSIGKKIKKTENQKIASEYKWPPT